MNQVRAECQVIPYPKIRQFLAAELHASHHMPMIHGLIEVDVSAARATL
jgi:hypothetical protein